jgi:hypothetical protein
VYREVPANLKGEMGNFPNRFWWFFFFAKQIENFLPGDCGYLRLQTAQLPLRIVRDSLAKNAAAARPGCQ